MPSNAPIIHTWGQLPPDYAPADWNDLVQQVAKLLSSTLSGSYNTFNWGSSTPAPEDQDKPWVRMNVDGSPDGTYMFFNGVWCRPHPVEPATNLARLLWFGTPEQLRSFDGGDGTDASPTEFTGAMWEIDSSYPASFLCTTGTFASSGELTVGSQLTSSSIAGVDKVTLTVDQIPEHSHSMTWDRNDSAGGSQANTMYFGSDSGAEEDDITKNTGVAGGLTGVTQPHTNLPPMVGVHLIKRTARKYIVL